MTDGGEVKQHLSRGRSEVLDAIQGLGGEATFTEVTKAVTMHRSNVHGVLGDLVNMGYLVFTNRRYALVGEV